MSTSARKKAERSAKLKAAARQRAYEQQLVTIKPKQREFRELTLPDNYVRETQVVPSLNSTEYNTFKVADKKYTGTLVKGVMESHKSNLLPVVDNDHIVDITRMRR